MEKIEAWRDSKGEIHSTEAEALAAETEIALLPFVANYAMADQDGNVGIAHALSCNAQEIFDILAGLGYEPSAQREDPQAFAEQMCEAAPERPPARPQAAESIDDTDPF